MTKRILLADDSLTIQKVVELTFSDSDYELVCVSNGQRALEKVEEDRPDLILADVVMPEKNGYEVCEAIKGNPTTSRIPVVLLSGTFEPFDRPRAERIGADAIVSKPFDSQQLLAQVDALLDRPHDRSGVEPEPESAPEHPAPLPKSEAEPEPFDVGFSAEDFTASIRRPPEGLDPFEEEYGRGDVDSAVEAFEKSRPEFVATTEAVRAPIEFARPEITAEEETRETSAAWLTEEPEKGPSPEPPRAPEQESVADREAELDAERTVAVRLPEPAPPPPAPRADEGPTQEIPQLKPQVAPFPDLPAFDEEPERRGETEEISAADAHALFEVPESPSASAQPEPPSPPEAPESSPEPPALAAAPVDTGRDAGTAEVPSEIEMLAQRASIPELTEMFSSVAKNGSDLTEEQIERLAARVVEKLSDRIVREIAWEVVPEMAEIVIKKRIKELEAGIE